jgi:NADPH:quinone reductase-like Zn-dependent oxidoreductase
MASMRAAILRSFGSVPVVDDWPEPDGHVAEVMAAALNPVDLRIASGTFYGGAPDPPYVVGGEAVVRRDDGSRAYVAAPAAFAERLAIEPRHEAKVPGGVSDGLALACGVPGSTALAALERGGVGQGDSVLVLGARGAVGTMAVQIAPLLGAGRVVGASRTPTADGIGLEAVEDAGPFDVVVDPLWGPPAEAASRALAAGGRLVQLGQSAGGEATFESSVVRGMRLEILGLALPALGPDARRALFERVVGWAAEGRLEMPVETYPLERVGEAWERQAASPGAKLVLVP